MASPPDPGPRPRPARRWFWVLTLVAVAASGSLSAVLAAPPGGLTGVRVAVSVLVLITAVTLAARVLVALEHARRRGGR